MSSDPIRSFDKKFLRKALSELGKQYRKLSGKNIPAEIILVGGASIVANYGFREMTTDVDALIYASSAMKAAISRVSDKFSLPARWLNEDFKCTDSFSIQLREVSEYYGTFSNVLEVRTIRDEFLIAMKLRSGRLYRHDLSDIVGILAEHEKINNPISKKQIMMAIEKLYGKDKPISDSSLDLLEKLFRKSTDFAAVYNETVQQERYSQSILLTHQEESNEQITEANANEIIKRLERRAKKD